MKYKWIVNLLIGLTGLFGVFTVVRILMQFHLFDFAIYYKSVEDINQGISMYRDTTIAMKYPMTAMLILYPIGWLPYLAAEKIWTLISLGSLILSMYFVAEMIPQFTKRHWIYISCLIILFFPYKFTLGMGQINLIILAALIGSIYAYLRSYKVLAGTLISIAAWIKITPLILLLYFVRKGEYKIVFSALAFYVLGWVLAGQFFDYDFVREFIFEVVPTISTLGNDVYYNQAFTGLLSRFNVPDSIAGIVNYLTLAAMLFVSYIVTPVKRALGSIELASFGMFVLSMLLSAGLAWQHHFVWTLISFLGIAGLLTLDKKKEVGLWVILFLGYGMIGMNIKNPDLYVGWRELFLSHATFGAMILWLLSIKILKSKTELTLPYK